jgi:alpha-1,2-rhamnosyltransferase
MRPILYIECTHTHHSDVQSGIQRVVRNIMRNASGVADRHGYDLVPVVYEGDQFRETGLEQVLHDKLTNAVAPAQTRRQTRLDRLRSARDPRELAAFIARPLYRRAREAVAALLPFAPVRRFLFAHPMHFGLSWCLALPLRLIRRTGAAPVFVLADPAALKDGFGPSLDCTPDQTGNILLLLDSSWHLQIWDAVERFIAAGGTTQTVIYDLIPITHPDTVMRSLRDVYTAWMARHVKVSRRFMAISRSTAAELDEYLAGIAATEQHPLPWSITPFYLGSELDLVDSTRQMRPQVAAMFEGHRHVFIMVGSIEPRKNHRFVLDAFDRVWAKGGTARLVIIGRHGWKTEGLVARIQAHPQFGSRLFIARDMDDFELEYAYAHTSALLIASEAEGFGLPVVEAFQRGVPVLCSDIPVFREIADGRATFFSLAGSQLLADAITVFCAERDPSTRLERQPQPWLTWRESTEQLLDAVLSPIPPPVTVRLADRSLSRSSLA